MRARRSRWRGVFSVHCVCFDPRPVCLCLIAVHMSALMQEELCCAMALNLKCSCAFGVYIIYLCRFLLLSYLIFNYSPESLNFKPTGGVYVDWVSTVEELQGHWDALFAQDSCLYRYKHEQCRYVRSSCLNRALTLRYSNSSTDILEMWRETGVSGSNEPADWSCVQRGAMETSILPLSHPLHAQWYRRATERKKRLFPDLDLLEKFNGLILGPSYTLPPNFTEVSLAG